MSQRKWTHIIRVMLSVLLAGAVFTAEAFDRGINYDPAHSVDYLSAQSANNIRGMKLSVEKDFEVIEALGFTHVRTFNSRYGTIDGKSSGLLADAACPRGIKLLLGVYEFRNPDNDCANWCLIATQKEVTDAIISANRYPGCIVGIAVGNEDITNWNFSQRLKPMEQRILGDIREVKSQLQHPVPVGTVQQDGALLKLSGYGDGLSTSLISSLDFVGANIYPYWDSANYDELQGQAVFLERYNAVKAKFTQPIIVTEEGWPSQYNGLQNPNASLVKERAYYAWWKRRAAKDTFSSYYFSMFDKIPSSSDNGADIYFGLCRADRGRKVLNCQLP